MKKLKLLSYLLIGLCTSSLLLAEGRLRVVGSGTLYPLSTVLAENFVRKNSQFNAPIVEPTGTGAGFKLFCEGLGLDTPDVTNASRRVKDTELSICAENGVENVLEVKIGYDALMMVQPNSVPQMDLTEELIFLAIAAQVPSSTGALIANPYEKWSDIDASLPNIPIKVIGPIPLSGTRDTLVELVMEKACHTMYQEGVMKVSEEELEVVCQSIRTDGAYINGGENYILFIQKVAASQDTLAILGYSFYEQNEGKVTPVKIGGITPNQESFAAREYPLFRSLYMYFKEDKIGIVEGLDKFLLETVSDDAIGQNGYLKENGLIPLSPEELKELQAKVQL